MALIVPCQGVLSHFVRLATLRRPLSVFGDGRQLRDPLFVEDAVDAFLVAGAANRPASRTYNVGGPEALPLARIAAIAAQSVDGPAPQYRPFPEELKAIDIGSYYTDGSRIRRELGWTPMVTFAEGIGKTIEYYRTELPHYLDPRDPRPVCPLPQPARLRRVPAAV
jgi:nucleoside-diphosphate-sugar epimerase